MADIKAARRRNAQPERALQEAVASFLDRALPPDAFWTSIDSAGRGARDGAKMKRRGVKRGLPDVMLLASGLTLWIELKSAKGRLSKPQEQFHCLARNYGHEVAVCRSVAEVENVLRYLGVQLWARLT